MLDHSNFSYTFPKKRTVGYENVHVGYDYQISETWVREIRFPPNIKSSIAGFSNPTIKDSTVRPYLQAIMFPRSHLANLYFDGEAFMYIQFFVWLSAAIRGADELNFWTRAVPSNSSTCSTTPVMEYFHTSPRGECICNMKVSPFLNIFPTHSSSWVLSCTCG